MLGQTSEDQLKDHNIIGLKGDVNIDDKNDQCFEGPGSDIKVDEDKPDNDSKKSKDTLWISLQ